MTTAMDIVKRSRDPNRAKSKEYIFSIFDNVVELGGDRLFSEDDSIFGAMAYVDKYPVMVIGQQKDKNFGMVKPEGYRKVIRLIGLSEKLSLPIITFVDTPGASCGIEAEERGQSNAIANCIMKLSSVRVPTLSIVIGEGGSGGALALSVTDEIWMLENSSYSILSPEGFSSILWKNTQRRDEAATLMRLTSKDIYEDGFIEKVILEDGEEKYKLKIEIVNFLEKRYATSIEKILKKRYDKYRKIIGG